MAPTSVEPPPTVAAPTCAPADVHALVGAVRRDLRAVQAARDDLASQRTVPVRTRQLRVSFVRPTGLPAVEPSLWHLHTTYANRRDTRSRTRLVEHYESHARTLASRFYRHREPLEDLSQVALEGLLLALDRFDPERRMPFHAFANPTIVGCLKRHYRDSGWAVRVPRRVHELSRPVREAADMLSQDLGRPPSNGEVADMLGVPEELVDEARRAGVMRATASLEAPAGDDAALGSMIGSVDPAIAQMENRAALRQSLELLPADDRLLLHLYYERELTQSQIADRIGVSQMQVSRSLARILKRLESHLPAD